LDFTIIKLVIANICDGGITATVEEHVVQWNPVVLRILSWRREEEKKLKERNLRRRRRNSHCASV
jgi:PAS domain-containing protein